MSSIIGAEISWWLFALFCGFLEAHYYDYVYFYVSRNHRNLHHYFDVFRTIYLLSLTLLLADTLQTWQMIVFGLFSAFTFSFWHNGMYGLMRNKLDGSVYKKKWWSVKEAKQIDGKESKFEWGVNFRVAGLIIGIIGIIYLIKEVQYSL